MSVRLQLGLRKGRAVEVEGVFQWSFDCDRCLRVAREDRGSGESESCRGAQGKDFLR